MSASETARLRGNELYKSGKIVQAIQCYCEASDLEPTNFAPWANLAAAHFETGNYEQSLASADKALKCLEADPAQAKQESKHRVLLRRVKAYLCLQDVKAAQQAWTACSEIPRNAEVDQIAATVNQLSTFTGAMIVPALPVHKTIIGPETRYEVDGLDPPSSLFDSSLVGNGTNDVSLLFVDPGDMRNVFSTILKFADPAIQKSADCKLDIVIAEQRTHLVARNLLIWSLLASAGTSSDAAASALEALVYTYTSAIMPRRCFTILADHIERLISTLESGNSFSASTYMSDVDKARIVQMLKCWQSADVGGVSVRDARSRAAQVAASGVNTLAHIFPDRMKREARLYGETGILISDQITDMSLLFKKLVVSFMADEDDLQAIDDTWKVNSTLFGPDSADWQTANDFRMKMQNSPFDLGSQIVVGEVSSTQGLFNIISKWFSRIAKAIASEKDVLNVGFHHGNVTQLLIDSHQGDRLYDRVHVSAFPDQVGGSLWTYMFAAPLLKQRPECYITWKSNGKAAGFKEWKNYDREYLNLSSEKGVDFKNDVEALFGLRVDKDTYQEDAASVRFESFGVVGYCRARLVGPARLGFDDLMPQSQLETWLYRLLLKFSFPCRRKEDSISDVISPFNLNTFFHLCRQLRRRGYPAHWLSNVIQSFGTGTIYTTARSPKTRPIKSKELLAKVSATQVDVTDVQEEFKNLTSAWSGALGFVPISSSDAQADHIRWSASFSQNTPVRDEVLALVLDKSDGQLKAGAPLSPDKLQGRSLVTTYEWDTSNRAAIFAFVRSSMAKLQGPGAAIGLVDTESGTVRAVQALRDVIEAP